MTAGHVVRGRLRPPSAAPPRGEVEHELVGVTGLTVRQVLSGELEQPADYCQDHGEWALVVAGSANLLAGPERLQLEAGDWVWLPAGTPHRLVRTEPGTSWVTVHVPTGTLPAETPAAGVPARGTPPSEETTNDRRRL